MLFNAKNVINDKKKGGVRDQRGGAAAPTEAARLRQAHRLLPELPQKGTIHRGGSKRHDSQGRFKKA